MAKFALVLLFCSSVSVSQTLSGDVTVRLLQGLDSSTQRVGQTARATVTNSSNPEIPTGTPALVQLVLGPAGGVSVQLVRPALASSGATGGRVSLRPGDELRFTLRPGPFRRSITPTGPRGTMPALRRLPATGLDLAPAAPGYPLMHASVPAPDGCWWAPFVSQKFGLEAAVSHCAAADRSAVAGESATGITLAEGSSSSPPEQILTVDNKPADQPIESAIEQQFHCPARCTANNGGLTTCNSCEKLMTILYRPTESRTKFLLFSVNGLGADLNEATIHFLPDKP